MDLNEKGWFQKYLHYRTSSDDVEGKDLNLPISGEHTLYKLVQPTGLMYGHPILPTYVVKEELNDLATNEKMKVVLTESLLKGAQLDWESLSPHEYEDIIKEFSKDLIEYYMEFYPELLGKNQDAVGSKKSAEKIAEEILDKRLFIKGSLLDNFWSSFFHNSLLFLDVFYFKEWINERHKITTIETLREEKENVRFGLLKLIAAASYADNVIEKEERKLFHIFLKSANLDSEKAKEAKTFIDKGLTVDDVEVPGDSWILRKYFLELAILTVWADRMVDEKEKEFIKKLSHKLGFSDSEMEDSMVAIESFVVTNWHEIHYLQRKRNFEVVSKLLIKRLTKIVSKNKDRISKEMSESKELMDLLSVSMSRDLTDVEKEKVRTQLIDILKILPTFIIIALPGTFLTLPILLKILPKSAFPTAFQE